MFRVERRLLYKEDLIFDAEIGEKLSSFCYKINLNSDKLLRLRCDIAMN